MSIESAKVISLVQPILDQTQTLNKSTVVAGAFKNVKIDFNGSKHLAKVSFSCLVQPEINDVVLIAGNPNDGFFILSILERPDSNDMTLNFPGNTLFNSHDGISLSSKKLSFISETSIYKSDKAFININEMTASGKTANISYKSINLLSNLISTLAKHSIQKFKTLIRHTEDSEQIKAGQLTCDVKGMYSLGSNYTILVSKKDTKIDGERIHMG